MILDPVIQRFLDDLASEGGRPVYTLTPEEARESLVNIQRAPFSTLLFLSSKVKDVEAEFAGYKLRMRVVRPTAAAPRCPAVLYFHGGGWVLGDATTHDHLVRDLAVAANAAIVFVEYDRAPEQQYPVAVEQCYAALCYVAENAAALQLDGTYLAIAGDSAGGNLAAAVCLLAKERKGPRLLGQVLFYPVTTACFDTDSMTEFAEGPWLTKDAMQWFWEQYVPDVERRKEPTASPLLAPESQLAGLPRTLIITAENDVLRDQGEDYGRKLIISGVDAVTNRYIGTIHDFVMLNAVRDSAPRRAAIAEAGSFLREVLAPED